MTFHISRELPHPQQPTPHDYEHPDNDRILSLTVDLLTRTPPCPSCGRSPVLAAGPGPEWHLEHGHEPWCPADVEPEVEPVFLSMDYDAGIHREAEEIAAISDGMIRCGMPRLDGTPCRTPVARPGDYCHWHRPKQ